MRLSFLWISLLFFTSSYAQQSIEVSIPYDNFSYNIKGTYLKAAKPTGMAALIIAGSGPTDRNCNGLGGQSNAYKYLATHLANNGISSIRYDKLGIGESVPGVPEEKLTFDDNVKVAQVVLDFLSQLDGVKQLVVIGHSEGSLVGMLLAQKGGVEKFVSLAGTAYPADEILKKQLNTLPDELKGDAFEKIDSLKNGFELKGFKTELLALFRPSLNQYFINWFQYNPRQEIAKLKMPVLVMQGDNDVQVSSDNGVALAMACQNGLEIILKDVNHVLKIAPRDIQGNVVSYDSPNVDIADEVKFEIIRFLK